MDHGLHSFLDNCGYGCHRGNIFIDVGNSWLPLRKIDPFGYRKPATSLSRCDRWNWWVSSTTIAWWILCWSLTPSTSAPIRTYTKPNISKYAWEERVGWVWWVWWVWCMVDQAMKIGVQLPSSHLWGAMSKLHLSLDPGNSEVHWLWRS